MVAKRAAKSKIVKSLVGVYLYGLLLVSIDIIYIYALVVEMLSRFLLIVWLSPTYTLVQIPLSSEMSLLLLLFYTEVTIGWSFGR